MSNAGQVGGAGRRPCGPGRSRARVNEGSHGSCTGANQATAPCREALLNGMNAGIEKGIEEGLRVDREWEKKLFQSKDAKEGMAAF